MEDPSRAPPTPETMEKKQASSSRVSSVQKSPSLAASISSSSYAQRADTDYDGADDGVEYAGADSGEFENDPVYNADVVRESDRSDHAEIPEHGTTRGLLAMFQNRQ